MTFRTAIRYLLHKFDHHRPIVEVGISRSNLLYNLRTYQDTYPKLAFAPVLKSNAYGHGLITIAKLLDNEHLPFFMVDSFFEARALRRDGIRTPLCVIGYVRPDEIARSRLRDVEFAIVDIEQLRELAKLVTHSIRIHIKIDTGMHRQGILPKDVSEAIALINSNPLLKVVGIYSHFADAESADTAVTDSQVQIWNETRAAFEVAFPSIRHIHFAATKGIRRFEELGVNLVRLGIGLYGFDTSHEADMPLLPVLELRSLISSLRTIPAGDFVGYNATYRTDKTATIATVPAGYFEGIDRELSNQGVMHVRGQSAPIAGRVSMNMSSLDVTSTPDAMRGDTVVAISRTNEDANSVRSIAKLASTTPYVILVHIPQHLKRVVE